MRKAKTDEELKWLFSSVTNWSLAFEEQADLSFWVDVLDRIDAVYAKYLSHAELKKELLLVPLSDTEKPEDQQPPQSQSEVCTTSPVWSVDWFM